VPGLLHVEKEALCFKCHSNLKRATGAEGAHPVFEEGKCAECHDSHASNNPAQLMEEVSGLCGKCHKEVNDGLDISTYPHRPVAEGRCVACHMPHGSKIKGGLPRPLDSLCYSCHIDFEKEVKGEGTVTHKPVADGECGKCHKPHASMERGLLAGKGDVLCNVCHSGQDSPEFIKKHGNIPVKGSDCLGCHEPHAGGDKRLLHKVMHVPFEKKNCERCHRTISPRTIKEQR